MLPSRSLRWAGSSISNGHQRVAFQAGNRRNYSVNIASTYKPRFTRPPVILRPFSAQQYRSLSIFGWGSSSKPSPDAASSASPASNVEIGPNTAGLDSVRTIRAAHGTSDAPDPVQAHLHAPNKIEPQIVEDLQEKITLPHGDASAKVADIVSGATDITAASERMGYLKDVCGLDFGWGPSSVMETVLEWLHVSAGLSWTLSIVTLAAILRVAMIKPIIDSQKMGKKMRDLQPYTQPLREQYMQLMQSGNRTKAVEVGAQLKELTKSAGISYSRAFIPLLIQLPFSFGAFRVLRNAGQLPVPAFVTENWLWTTDLSFSDPYYITPLISSIMIHLSFRLQQSSQNTMFGPQMMKVFSYGLPVMSFVFMSFQPGSVQLYFVTTGIFAFSTTALLRQQWFRNITDLGPVPTGPPVQSATSSPAQGSSTSQVSAKPLPAGIQRITAEAIVPEPVQVEAKPESNRSIIDRAVDNVKGGWKDFTKDSSVYGKKMAQRQKEQAEASNARYQAQRQMQIDKEREERNRQARDH